jgi:ABC-type multidrug transport system fused ATPase/permease subunit
MVRTFAAASIGLKLDLAPAAPASQSKSRGGGVAPPPAHKIPTDSYLGLARALIWTRLVPVFGLFVLTQLARIYSDIWISVWVSRSTPGRSEMFYLGVYGGYVAVFLVLLYLRGVTFMAMFSSAFSRLHDTMFSALLAAPLSFHSLTPLGSIISVVSKDMDNINDTLVDSMYLGLVCAFLTPLPAAFLSIL